MIVSYAQDAEDVLLQRVFPRDYRGFYIDAGASDPVLYSVTKHFYDQGWRGVNIEPVRSVWLRLREQRTRDVNLNVGLSDQAGWLTFYEVEAETCWSTFATDVAEMLQNRGVEVRRHQIPVMTLAQVCEEHAADPIDVLKVDVEGHEAKVIAGADWERWRPRVVLVENNSSDRWEPVLLGHGYHHAVTTQINRFYVRDEDRSLLPRFLAPLGWEDSFLRASELDDLRGRLGPAEPANGEAISDEANGPNAPSHGMTARRPRLAAIGNALLRLAQ
jgi:FkbM family methyltransferase